MKKKFKNYRKSVLFRGFSFTIFILYFLRFCLYLHRIVWIVHHLPGPRSRKAVYKMENVELMAAGSAKKRICSVFVSDVTPSPAEPQKFFFLQVKSEEIVAKKFKKKNNDNNNKNIWRCFVKHIAIYILHLLLLLLLLPLIGHSEWVARKMALHMHTYMYIHTQIHSSIHASHCAVSVCEFVIL